MARNGLCDRQVDAFRRMLDSHTDADASVFCVLASALAPDDILEQVEAAQEGDHGLARWLGVSL